MNKIYFKFNQMQRGLNYYKVMGMTQYYENESVWFEHYNRPFNSFMYVIADKVEFTINQRCFEFTKGNLIYVPKWINYKVVISGIDKDEPAVMQTFFNIKDQLENEYFYSDHPEKLFDSTPKQIIESMKSITHATYNMLYPSFTILKNFYTILEMTAQHEGQKSTVKEKNKRIAPALLYISNNLTESISVTELSRMCNMSETAFRAAFKSETGMSPCNYKNYVKIQKCMDTITDNPRISVQGIIEKFGFNDESYFYKVFYKYAGISYSEFKSKHI